MTAQRFAWDELPADHPMDKIERRRIVGDKVMISRVTLDAGFEVPSHRHENEQLAVVLSGRIRFGVGEEGSVEEIELVGGETLLLPSNTPHSARAIETTVILDVFSPPSETTGVDRG